MSTIKPPISVDMIETLCENCGKYYKKPRVEQLSFIQTKNICPLCRGKKAVDKTKRIIEIIKE